MVSDFSYEFAANFLENHVQYSLIVFMHVARTCKCASRHFQDVYHSYCIEHVKLCVGNGNFKDDYLLFVVVAVLFVQVYVQSDSIKFL